MRFVGGELPREHANRQGMTKLKISGGVGKDTPVWV